jgi:hypothetical protein
VGQWDHNTPPLDNWMTNGKIEIKKNTKQNKKNPKNQQKNLHDASNYYLAKCI